MMIVLSLHEKESRRISVLMLPAVETCVRRWMGLLFVVVTVASVFRDGVNLPFVKSFTVYPPHPLQSRQVIIACSKPRFQPNTSFQQATRDGDSDEDDDNETPAFNPYADPNYPDLEFVNYDDPEYSIDRSLSAAEADIEDESLLEQMREERRVANDEYQYNTYWHTVWNAGLSTYRGEWTVYYSSNFFPQFDEEDDDDKETEEENANGLPRLIQLSDAPLTVISRATRQSIPTTTTSPTTTDDKVLSENSYITHVEELEQGMGDVDLAMAGGADDVEQKVVSQTYWPTQLSQADFRGHQGIMICGKYVLVCVSKIFLSTSSLVHLYH
jgi:hypothetical protein